MAATAQRGVGKSSDEDSEHESGQPKSQFLSDIQQPLKTHSTRDSPCSKRFFNLCPVLRCRDRDISASVRDIFFWRSICTLLNIFNDVHRAYPQNLFPNTTFLFSLVLEELDEKGVLLNLQTFEPLDRVHKEMEEAYKKVHRRKWEDVMIKGDDVSQSWKDNSPSYEHVHPRMQKEYLNYDLCLIPEIGASADWKSGEVPPWACRYDRDVVYQGETYRFIEESQDIAPNGFVAED